MKSAALCLCLTTLCCWTPELAAAQPTPTANEADLDEARRRFQLGVKLYEEGSFDAALAEFNKAYELAPNYRVLFNLAQVQVQRNDSVAAVRLFKRYLEHGNGQIPPARRKQVERELTELKARVAGLWVRSNVGGAELFIDGTRVGELPLTAAVPVSSGVRQIQLRKPGYDTVTSNLTIAGNETLQIELVMQAHQAPLSVAAPSSVPPSRETPLPPQRRNPATQQVEKPLKNPDKQPSSNPTTSARTPLWISLVSSGLLAGGAVTFAFLTRAADAKLDTELDRFPPEPERIEAVRATLRRNALLTDGLTAAALIAGSLSLYFLLSDSDSPAANPAPTRPRVRLAPAGLGLSATATF